MRQLARVFGSFMILSLALLTNERACGGVAVSDVQIEFGGWTFVPTVDNGRVTSILALRTDGASVGQNIVSVWFQRGANTWRVTAWESQDQRDAVSFVKASLGIGNQFDQSWPVGGPFTMQTPQAPTAFHNGLLVGDTKADLIDSATDRRATMEALVLAGYRAAVLGIELADSTAGCDQNAILTVIAEGVQTELAQPAATSGAGMAQATAQLTLACAWCPIDPWWTWTIAGPTKVNCNCTFGASVGCEWNELHCAMVCHFTGTSNCTWTRTRKREYFCSGITCTWTETGSSSGEVRCTSTEYFVEPTGCNGNPTIPGNPGFPHVAPPGPDCAAKCPAPLTRITWSGAPPC